jgi:hypothetical protein
MNTREAGTPQAGEAGGLCANTVRARSNDPTRSRGWAEAKSQFVARDGIANDDVEAMLSEIEQQLPSRRPGDCETCGQWDSELREGMCEWCRQQYGVTGES